MARLARRCTWTVIPRDDGTYDLLRNNRPLASGLTERAVRQRIKRDARPNERIMIQESDGYLSPVGLSDLDKDRRKV
jgi:hypothetical protein